MKYICITAENIDKEHICCAMSNKQSDEKKRWMTERFKDGEFITQGIQSDKKFLALAGIKA